MTPTIVAEHAARVRLRDRLQFEVLDEDACRALGMGSFLSVSRGSDEPAQLVVLATTVVRVTDTTSASWARASPSIRAASR